MNGCYKKRINFIDFFRGVGILLMIMGHIITEKKFNHFIHAFHMPMFYFVSGLFFDIISLDCMRVIDFVRKKAKSLLLPYFLFGMFHYAMWAIINKDSLSIEPFLHIFSINTEGMPIAGALWFLTSLFITESIYFILYKYINSAIVIHIIIVILSIFGNMELTLFKIRLPFALGASFVGLGIFHIAHILSHFSNEKRGKEESRVFNLSLLECGIGSLVLIILIYLNGYIDMRQGLYGFVPLFWINAIGISIIGLNLCKYFQGYLGQFSLNKFVVYIGRNSIIYVCLNELIISISSKVLGYIGIVNNISIWAIELIITILALSFICIMFKGSKRYIF